MTEIFLVKLQEGRTFNERIVAGNYNVCDPEISLKIFSIRRTGSSFAALYLVHLDCVLVYKDIFKYIEFLGFKPRDIEHLLAFGEKFPEIQLEKFPIMALSSLPVNTDGAFGVPFLTRGTVDTRNLSLRWIKPNETLSCNCHFLASFI